MNNYIDIGWRVIPLKKNNNTPVLRGSWKDYATKNKEQIDSWIKEGYNLGYIIEKGHLILDFDKQHGGLENLEILEGFGFSADRTMKVNSPSGGFHLYFSIEGIESLENIKQWVDH